MTGVCYYYIVTGKVLKFNHLTFKHSISFGKLVHGVEFDLTKTRFHFTPVMNVCHVLHGQPTTLDALLTLFRLIIIHIKLTDPMENTKATNRKVLACLDCSRVYVS